MHFGGLLINKVAEVLQLRCNLPFTLDTLAADSNSWYHLHWGGYPGREAGEGILAVKQGRKYWMWSRGSGPHQPNRMFSLAMQHCPAETGGGRIFPPRMQVFPVVLGEV